MGKKKKNLLSSCGFKVWVFELYRFLILFILLGWQIDMQYLHAHAAISSSIGLAPTPRLELAATVGSKDLNLGAEIGFDTASASFTKYNVGIGFDKQDFSASLIL